MDKEKKILNFWDFEALPKDERSKLSSDGEEDVLDSPELEAGEDAEIEIPEPVEGEVESGDDEASDDTIDFDNLSTGVEDLDSGDGANVDFEVDLGSEGNDGESEEGTATGDELDLNLGSEEESTEDEEEDEDEEESSKEKEDKE